MAINIRLRGLRSQPIPEGYILGRLKGTGEVQLLSAADLRQIIAGSGGGSFADFIGDSGSGGKHGLVPAPAAGDAAAGKFLAAAGDWENPSISPANGGNLIDFSAGVVADSDFSWINQGTATITEVANKALELGVDASKAMAFRIKSVPSTPYRIAICMKVNAVRVSTAEFAAYVGWYDNSTGKSVGITFIPSTAGPLLNVDAYNASPYAFNSNKASVHFTPQGDFLLGLHDDGTNVIFEFSADGVNWWPVYTVAKSAGFLGSSGYNRLFFGANTGALGATGVATIRLWDENGLSRSFP